MTNKDILREEYFNIRNSLSLDKVLRVSRKITNMFINLEIVKKSRNFMLYYSFKKEIITYDLIDILFREGKNVFLPYISNNKIMISRIYSRKDLKPGAFGIMEPVERQNIDINKMDVIVVPGLLFDKNGYRIGYGGGYYDRLLSSITSDITTIGLVYDDFLQERLPIARYDMPVKIILSEKQVLHIGGINSESF